MTVATKTWNEDHEHSQFHFYGSTPDVGTVEQGTAFTFIVRGGSVIKIIEGLVSGFVSTEDGDEAHGYYIDSAGNAGDWVTHTFTVTGAFDRTYYVDATGGSDSNDGLTTGAPKQTLVAAITALTAAWVSGESNRILLKCGESFDTTGASAGILWNPGAYTGCITFGSYDTGARPELTLAASGNGSQFINGTLGLCGVTVRGINVTGGDRAVSVFFRCTTVDASSTGANVAVIDCDLATFSIVFLGIAGTLSDFGRTDFAAWKNVSVSDYNEDSWRQFHFGRYHLVQDCSFGSCFSASTNGHMRGIAWQYMCVDNTTFDRSGGTSTSNVFRIQGGAGTDANDYAQRINVHKVHFVNVSEGAEIDSVETTQKYYRDIDFNACSMSVDAANTQLVKAIAVTGNYPDVTRMRLRNCWYRGPSFMLRLGSASAETERIRSVTIEHCSVYGTNTANIFGAGFALSLNEGTGGGVLDDAITVRNNYFFDSNTTGNAAVMTCPPAAIGFSDYNVARRAGTGTFNWESSTNLSLANWFSTHGFDEHSSSANNTTDHNYTDVTLAGWDARPASDSGPQNNAGLAGVALVDADKNLWTATTPDVGAFQFGGVAMDGPPSGVTGTIAATMPGFDASAAGSPIVNGTAVATMPAFTATAAGSPIVSGSASATLPGFVASAFGSGATVTGTVAASLAAFAAAAAGSPIVNGTAVATLPAFRASATDGSTPPQTNKPSGIRLGLRLGI